MITNSNRGRKGDPFNSYSLLILNKYQLDSENHIHTFILQIYRETLKLQITSDFKSLRNPHWKAILKQSP